MIQQQNTYFRTMKRIAALLLIPVLIIVFGLIFYYCKTQSSKVITGASKENLVRQKESQNNPPQEEVTAVAYTMAGGRMGYFFNMIISKDQLITYTNLSAYQHKKGQIRKIRPEEWKKILTSFKLEDFKKVKSGKSRAPIDGIDRLLIVYTPSKTYQLINGAEDKINYLKINNLVEYLLHFKN